MRPIAVILMVVALVASGLAAFLAKRWLTTSAERQEAAAQAVEVLVAARDVPAGLVLQAGDLRWDRWPLSLANPRLVTRTAGQDPAARFVGRTVRFGLTESEPLSDAAVFKPEAGVLAGMLAPGMRAISIAITTPSGVSGFVMPGDRVDVVLGADVAREQGKRVESGPVAQYASETILEDVRVLAIDQQIARGRDGAAILGKTATLEVTSKQGEVLTTAGMMGQLSLVLRGPGPDSGPAARPGTFTPDTEVSKALEAVRGSGTEGRSAIRHHGTAIRVNRGGSISTKSF